MEVRRNLLGFLVCVWLAAAVIAVSVGLGVRFGLYGWRHFSFFPGEEIVFLTGGNEGIFCETVMLQSSGYITGQNIQIRDWEFFEKAETDVEHLAVSLADRYYYFR